MKYINTMKVVGILILSNKFPDLQKKVGGGGVAMHVAKSGGLAVYHRSVKKLT